MRPLLFLVVAATGCGDDYSSSNGPDMAVPIGGPTLPSTMVSKSKESLIEAETDLVAAAHGVVAIAYNAQTNGPGFIGYAFSRDDGTTWEKPQAEHSPKALSASDPVMAVDGKNNIYLAWIGFNSGTQPPSNYHVYAAVAPAGTTAFGSPVEVNQGTGAYDKPWITLAGDGAVLITYTKMSTGGIYAARSSDGMSWDNHVVAEGNGFRNLAFPCHPTSGPRMYVVYHSGIGVRLSWSDDHGVTWDGETEVVPIEDGKPAFVDPNCAADGNEVWITYGSTIDPPGMGNQESAKLNGIRIAHSNDGGKTIDWVADAQDAQATDLYMLPALVREPVSGALDLVYFAGNFEGDKKGSLRRSRSTDGGKSWIPSLSIRDSITFIVDRTTPNWLGDYLGLRWARGNLYVSFTDNSKGTSHISFYRTAVP